MATTDNMFQTRTAPLAETEPAPGALLLRRVMTIAGLVAFFPVMAVGTALDPLDDSATSAETVRQAAGHTGVLTAVAWMELTCGILLISGLLGLVGMIRARGAGWANGAGALGVLSGIGMAALAFNSFVVVGVVKSGVSASTGAAVIDAFHTAGGAVPVLFMLSAIVFIPAAIACWRAGLLPKAAVLLGVLIAVIAFVPTPAAEYVTHGVGFALAVWIASAIARQPVPR